jgi:hypothetical protein
MYVYGGLFSCDEMLTSRQVLSSRGMLSSEGDVTPFQIMTNPIFIITGNVTHSNIIEENHNDCRNLVLAVDAAATAALHSMVPPPNCSRGGRRHGSSGAGRGRPELLGQHPGISEYRTLHPHRCRVRFAVLL